MKKITGEFLNQCKVQESIIRRLLAENMPQSFHDRNVDWEYCKSTRKAGYCIMCPNSDKVIIRITEYVALDDVMAVVRHELLHAFLPFNEMHGELFMQASNIIEQKGFTVSHGATGAIKEEAYKYLLFTSNGQAKRYTKKNKYVSFVLKNQGYEIDGVQYYVTKLK